MDTGFNERAEHLFRPIGARGRAQTTALTGCGRQSRFRLVRVRFSPPYKPIDARAN
jgi:hypothetical protein